ncbi:hypothetical protein [Streptacidiphilus anmyonensis]|uniref:hypothetical protein n=1 Tax=Streptacidiphilus anmyonensis TaxID=405782 RepID=UPI0005A786CC|nr:hypothetical protein [Streptacidiphilus anmyonensis]
MTTDTSWTDLPPTPGPETEPEPEPEAAHAQAAGRGNRKATLAVLISLVTLAGLAVGFVVLLGASASAAGGCGGG